MQGLGGQDAQRGLNMPNVHGQVQGHLRFGGVVVSVKATWYQNPNVVKNVQISQVDFKVKTLRSCRGSVGKTLRGVLTCLMSMAKSRVISVSEE